MLARLHGIAAGDEQTFLLHFPTNKNKANHDRLVNIILNGD